MARFSQSAFVFIMLISFVFAPCMGRAQSEPQVDPQILEKLMTVEDYKKALPEKQEELFIADFLKLKGQGNVVVLDVRSKDSFARSHLKGSVSAPLTDLTEKNLPALVPDKNAHVVLACDYTFQPVRMLAMTIQAYPVLRANGYANIYRLNLWMDKNGGEMRGAEAQAKLLEFEGTEVKPAKE